MKRIMFAGALLLTVFTACKKDKDDQTTTERVLGRWSLSKSTTSLAFDGYDPSVDTYTGVSTDYFDFGSDGKLVVNYDGDEEIGSYQVLGDTAMVIEGNHYKITTLTKSQLSLYSKQSFSGGYTEDIYDLKR